MKVSGNNRPKGILKGARKDGGLLEEIHLNPSSGRSATKIFKIYSGRGWSNEGNGKTFGIFWDLYL